MVASHSANSVRHAWVIDLLSPQVEWLRLHTQLAREALQRARCDAREVLSQHALFEAAETMCQSEQAEAIYAALPALFERVADETCNQPGYMANNFRVDVSSQPGVSIMSFLSSEDRIHLEREIRKRQYAAIGEMVWRLRPDNLDSGQPEALTDIEPLACEDGRNIYSGQLGRARRVQELQAQLGITEH